MVVLNGSAGTNREARLEWARPGADRVAAAGGVGRQHRERLGEVWYYISSTDQYSRRIEGDASGAGRVNHIVLWARQAADAAGAALPMGCELGCRAGVDGVSVSYGPGLDPATATITIGSASVVFDPRTVADVIVWTYEARLRQRHQGRFTWDAQARGGAGAFVFAGHVGAGTRRADVPPARDGDDR